MKPFLAIFLVTPWLTIHSADSVRVESLGTNLSAVHGAVNGVRLEANGKTLVVYGDPRENPPRADRVLLTHVRRDVAWAARGLVQQGEIAVLPKPEAQDFLHPQEFWRRFEGARFHSYSQPSTKVLAGPMPGAATVWPGETLTWEGIPIRITPTPSCTAGAITYLVSLEGRTIAFTGDLIQGDGRTPDLYSFQDRIPDARIGAYHYYAARLGDLVASLRRLQSERPDVLVPARGPVIREPAKAMTSLLDRVQSLYSNYLSIDAVRWYFGDQHMLTKARRVLGPGAAIEWMPIAEINSLPRGSKPFRTRA